MPPFGIYLTTYHLLFKIQFYYTPPHSLNTTYSYQPDDPINRGGDSSFIMRPMISLYTGCGGLDLGFERAGFDPSICIELDKDCCRTVSRNRNWPIICNDIANVSSDEILSRAGLRIGEADVLVGGPPCQPFSQSAHWLNGGPKRLNDPRAITLIEYMRVLENCLPKTFLIENVPGLIHKGKNEGYQFICQRIEEINRKHGTSYSISSKILNAADYGVPQIRERIFIVGSRDGKAFQFPKPLFAPQNSKDQSLPRHRTAWDALGDLSEKIDEAEYKITGKWADLVPSIPEGKNYLWHTEGGGGLPLFQKRSRYWTFLLKLAKSRPSWTIQAQVGSATGPFHWKNRRLTIRELARLQTFPDDYQFVGTYRSIHKQIGNAVPPALSEMLALEIRRQFFGDDCISKASSLVPPERDIPPPEPIAEVPSKYLKQQ